jgi:hypothetical protein
VDQCLTHYPTFDIVGRCFLFLLVSGAGLYFILLAFIPSWRKKGPIHLETYLGSWRSKDEPTVIAEWDMSESTSARINAIVGGIFMFGGIAGIIWTWHLR